MPTLEKVLVAIVAIFLAILAPGAISVTDMSIHRIGAALGVISDPAVESTQPAVLGMTPQESALIRGIIERVLGD